MDQDHNPDNKRKLPVDIPEKVIGGVYANQMVIGHTREEFLLDFINLFPPRGVVNARVIVTLPSAIRTSRTMPNSIRLRCNSGSITPFNALRT